MEKTINQIRRELEEIAEKHSLIRSFFFGDFLDAISGEESVNYPLMVVQLLPGSIGEGFVSTRLSITIADKHHLDSQEQINEIHSDTQRICNDIKNIFNSYRFEDYIKPGAETQLQPFQEKTADALAGWIMNFEVRSFDASNYCEIPIQNYDFENSPFIRCDEVVTIDPDCDPVNITINGEAFGTYNAGTTNNIEVRDTADDLEGFKDGSVWRVEEGAGACDDGTILSFDGSTLGTVPSGGNTELPLIFNEPAPTGSTIVNDTYDDAWNRLNNWFRVQPIFGELVKLNPLDARLMSKSYITGVPHLFRYIGTTGGYYDHLTGDFKDVNGVVTTEEIAFPNDLAICIYNGIIVSLANQPKDTYQNSLSYANSFTQLGLFWKNANPQEYTSLFLPFLSNSNRTPFDKNNLLYGVWLGLETAQNPNNAHATFTNGEYTVSRTGQSNSTNYKPLIIANYFLSGTTL